MRFVSLIAATALVACAGSGPQPTCGAAEAWSAGQQGIALSGSCREDRGSAEAHLLGSELAQLRAREARLKGEIGAAPEDRKGALQRQLRQLQVDIEAIEGVAVVNGWK